MFSKRIRTSVAALIGCLVLVAVQASDPFQGAWQGTWEGAGSSGRFNLTLTKSGDAWGGKVDVGQDTGDYTATLANASFEGSKFKARYEYTPDPQAEIVLESTFTGSDATGTWSMVQKGGNESFASGSWTVSKK